eukprot:4742442-Amphidinium_carterae.2
MQVPSEVMMCCKTLASGQAQCQEAKFFHQRCASNFNVRALSKIPNRYKNAGTELCVCVCPHAYGTALTMSMCGHGKYGL